MQVLAFDLGASTGRAIVGDYRNGKISLHEIHRFSNDPVVLNKHIYWDFPRLFHELKTALVKAKHAGYCIKSIGIDAWGVDYGLIDSDGELMGNPIHYRDERAQKGMDQLLKIMDKNSLKKRTGMDCMSYNTINQLMSDRMIGRAETKALLNIPDLFNYFLTGEMVSEYSMVTTTQLYDYSRNDWNDALIDELGFNRSIFQKIGESGKVIGTIKDSIIEELNIEPIKVVSVTSHDTSVAISSIPEDDEAFLFIATGTWIIVGTKQKRMMMNEHVMAHGLTNEGGKFPNVNLLKNHVGLWILQESKKYWEKSGQDISFARMVELGQETDIDAFIDIMDERFFEPGNMPEKVKAYCSETNQVVPESVGQIVKVIEQSLARQIADTLFAIEEAVGKSYDKVHIFGGGVQDQLLCRLIEDYSNKKVIIGPKEATAFGNVTDQLLALGVMTDQERMKVIRKSLV